MTSTNCHPRIDWFGLVVGAGLFTSGFLLTLTWIGAVIGVPVLLASLGLFINPTTMRGTPCAH